MGRSDLVSDFAFVVPAWNEEKTIAKVIEGIKHLGTVIVVNDCSSDRTAEVAETSGAIVVNHSQNFGYEQAIASGFEKAETLSVKFVITLDADGQHPSEILPQFIEALQNGIGLVVGNRHDLPRFSEKWFRLYSRERFGIADPCCGLKGYRIEDYLSKGNFSDFESIGTDLAFYAVAHGARVKNIDFDVLPRLDQPRFGQFIKANWKLLKALLHAYFKYRR